MTQASLFPADFPRFAAGFHYEPEFLSAGEEAELLAIIQELPLAAAEYKQYLARRRVVSYGGRFDYESNTLSATRPIPTFLHTLRARVAAWAGQPAESFQQALIAEYFEGNALGLAPRRTPVRSGGGRVIAELVPNEVSTLPAWATREVAHPRIAAAVDLPLGGEARWGWQHSVPAVDELRYSITFRTLRVL